MCRIYSNFLIRKKGNENCVVVKRSQGGKDNVYGMSRNLKNVYYIFTDSFNPFRKVAHFP